MTVEQDLAEAIAELLHVSATALARVGTDKLEGNAMLGADLITKMRRQRVKVDQSLDGPPELHAAHVRALAAGMRACMKRLEEVDG
jgi:hypothetical protein